RGMAGLGRVQRLLAFAEQRFADGAESMPGGDHLVLTLGTTAPLFEVTLLVRLFTAALCKLLLREAQRRMLFAELPARIDQIIPTTGRIRLHPRQLLLQFFELLAQCRFARRRCGFLLLLAGELLQRFARAHQLGLELVDTL